MITATADGTPVGIDGAPPSVIPPGVYELDVFDPDGSMAFQLYGPGVNLLATKSPTVITVTFEPNSTYVYQDANNMGGTNRTLVVSGPGTAVTTPRRSGSPVSNSDIVGSATAARVLGTLHGSLTATGVLSLTDRGQAVSKLATGRYKLVLSDASAKSGLTLRDTGKRAVRLTTVRFVGEHTLTLTLAAGHWSLSTLGVRRSFVVVDR